MATSNTAVKNDEGKNRMDLIPAVPLMHIAEVLTVGAKKYGDRNWEDGLEYSRVYAAALRHLTAWWNGIDTDWDDGLSHLAHAATNIMFLQEFCFRRTGKDDRPHRN